MGQHLSPSYCSLVFLKGVHFRLNLPTGKFNPESCLFTKWCGAFPQHFGLILVNDISDSNQLPQANFKFKSRVAPG